MFDKEIFEVTVWCEIDEFDSVTAKDVDNIVGQLKDLSHHCEVADGLGCRQFRIDDKTETVSEDYDEQSLVTGQINVYGATFAIADARELAWDAREIFNAFGISKVYRIIEG